MSQIRPDPKPPKHRIAACRKGSHAYAEGQQIGAGIMRRVCETCSYVTIDLTASELKADGTIERYRLTSARR